MSNPTSVNTSALPQCRYCSGFHTGTCPRIKRINYYPNGSVKSVELHKLVAGGGENTDGR